jgi:hypothetical protein
MTEQRSIECEIRWRAELRIRREMKAANDSEIRFLERLLKQIPTK